MHMYMPMQPPCVPVSCSVREISRTAVARSVVVESTFRRWSTRTLAQRTRPRSCPPRMSLQSC